MGKDYEYTLEDCRCEYCLYFDSKEGCQQEVCCCLEEKRTALVRMAASSLHQKINPKAEAWLRPYFYGKDFRT